MPRVIPRLANSWWLTALLDFEEFQERRPSKGELRIIIKQFNSEFQAGRTEQSLICAQGLALRKPMEKDAEANQVGFKLQRLWSGLRKRWADSTSGSKRAGLQSLKDKMRPCYNVKEVQSTETDVAEVPMTLANSDSETEIEDEDVFRPMPLDAVMFQKNKAFLDMCGVGLARKKSFVSCSASCALDVLAFMCYVPLVGCGPHVFC